MKSPILSMGLMLVAGSLSAQEAPNWVAIQGGAASRSSIGDTTINSSGIVGLSGGLWFNPRWGADLSILGSQFQTSSGNTFMEYHAQIAGLLNLNPNPGPWVPYLRAGLGETQIASTQPGSDFTSTRFSYHGGLGIQYFQGEHLLLGLEARATRISTNATTAFTETTGLITVGYRWGGKPPAPMVMPEPEPMPAPPAPPPPPPPPRRPSPPPVVVLPPPPPPPLPAKIVLDEARLHFANSKAGVPPAGMDAIAQVAQTIKTYPGQYQIVVTGYTSAKGDRTFNLDLSKRRADAVALVLEASGIPSTSIQTVGRGPDDPIGDNATKEGRDLNRRVEIDIHVASDNVIHRKAVVLAKP